MDQRMLYSRPLSDHDWNNQQRVLKSLVAHLPQTWTFRFEVAPGFSEHTLYQFEV
jgi:hypothetical protein